MNKNDNPIKTVDETLLLKDFYFLKQFSKIGILTPELSNERLIFTPNEKCTRCGLVYLFAIDDFIQKIGETTVSITDRIKSYNCGKRSYRNNGTCSTSNYFVLQSFLNIGKNIDVYGYYPEEINVNVFGENQKISIPPKIYEKKILTELKKQGKMPILCTQK